MTATIEVQLSFGRQVEQKVAESLRQMYRVIVLGDLPARDGLGPRLSGDGETIVLADLQIFGPRHGWLEVKYKTKANFFRQRDCLEHGIDSDKWLQYQKLQAETRLPFYLLICEGETGELLMQEMNTLRSTHRFRQGEWPNNGKPSMNWDRRVFEKVGTFDIPNRTPKAMRIRWDWETLNGFLSQLALYE